jgi:hypothetical protein
LGLDLLQSDKRRAPLSDILSEIGACYGAEMHAFLAVSDNLTNLTRFDKTAENRPRRI